MEASRGGKPVQALDLETSAGGAEFTGHAARSPESPPRSRLFTPTASFALSAAPRIPRATARAGHSARPSMVANTRTTCRRRSLPQTPRAGRAHMCPSRKAAASWTALVSGWRTRRAADRFRFFFLQAPCREERGAYIDRRVHWPHGRRRGLGITLGTDLTEERYMPDPAAEEIRAFMSGLKIARRRSMGNTPTGRSASSSRRQGSPLRQGPDSPLAESPERVDGQESGR